MQAKPNNNSTVGTIRADKFRPHLRGNVCSAQTSSDCVFCPHLAMRTSYLIRHFLEKNSDHFGIHQTCSPIVLSVAVVGSFGLRFAVIWAQVTRIERWVKANSAIPRGEGARMPSLLNLAGSPRPTAQQTRRATFGHQSPPSRSLSWGRGPG